MPMTMEPISGPNLEKYISKCSVCESPTRSIGKIQSPFYLRKGWQQKFMYIFLSTFVVNKTGSKLTPNLLDMYPNIFFEIFALKQI